MRIFNKEIKLNSKMIENIKRKLELIFWVAGLIILFFIEPERVSFSICPLHNLNLWCPGCGLGSSIHYLLHFDLLKSFQVHPIGFFAFIVILYRLIQLINNNNRRTYNG